MKIVFLDFDGVLIPTTFSGFLRQMENISLGDSPSKDESDFVMQNAEVIIV